MNVQDFLMGVIFGVLLCLAFVAILSTRHSSNATAKKEEDPADWWKHGRKQEEDEEEFQ